MTGEAANYDKISKSEMAANCRILPMTEMYISEVARLEREVFPDAWTEQSLADFCRSNTWRGFLALEGEALAGYLLIQQVLDEGEVLRIATNVSYRRRGIASQLLREVFEATPEILFWNLEVRESNTSARACYEKMGFAEIGVRKNYYHEPTEHAILMQKVIER